MQDKNSKDYVLKTPDKKKDLKEFRLKPVTVPDHSQDRDLQSNVAIPGSNIMGEM